MAGAKADGAVIAHDKRLGTFGGASSGGNYWLNGTAGSAAYVGYAQRATWGVTKSNSGVPTASLVFAHDVVIRRYCETQNTITRWTAGVVPRQRIIDCE